MSLLGAVFIILGVAGEMLFGGFTYSKETQLRNANTMVSASLQLQANQAIIEASQANLKIGDDDKQIAALLKEAEGERLARVKIEERVAWRSLSAPQMTEVAMALKGFAGQVAVMAYNANDVEAEAFAMDIASSLVEANWHVSAPQSMLILPEGPIPLANAHRLQTGVTVTSTTNNRSHQAADALVRELLTLGFDANRAATDDPRTDANLFIMIDPRPKGGQGGVKLRAPQK